MRAVARSLVLVAAAIGGLVVTASPAFAHGSGGADASNYETRIRGIYPAGATELTVRAVPPDGQLELRNDSEETVVVLGYRGEPYLRIGPDGVFENAASPAVELNRSSRPDDFSAEYEAGTEPDWRRVSSGRTARWHDHRTHFMGSSQPPIVREDPGTEHIVVEDWAVPLRQAGRELNLRGDAVWVPGPSAWPWVAGAVIVAVVVVGLSRTSRWPSVLAVATGALVVAEIVHVAGTWSASTDGMVTTGLASLYSLGACVVGLFALGALAVRDPWDAVPAVLIAGVFLLIVGGLSDLSLLSRSQLFTALPENIARLCVATNLGLGAGVVVGAALRLRAPTRPRVATRPDPPPAGPPRTPAGSSRARPA